MLCQHSRSNLGVLADQLVNGVGNNIRSRVSKFDQSLETRIRLAQNAVAITRHHTARLERVPEIGTDVVVGELDSNLFLHGNNPAKHLLGGKTMQRTGETEQTCRVAEERIAKGTSHQMGCVSRDIATLVVTMKGKIQSQQVVEVTVGLSPPTEELRKVVGPILLGVESLSADGVDLLGAENQGGDTRNLGEERNTVIKSRLPVLCLVETFLVGLSKRRLGVQSSYRDGKLRHWMHVIGERLDQFKNVRGEVRLLGQFTREGAHLRHGWDLTRQKQPEHGLWKHLRTRGALGQLVLAVLNGFSVETNSLIRIQDRAFPQHGLQSTHPSQNVGNLDIANDTVTAVPDLFQEVALGGNNLFQGGLEVGLGRRVPAASGIKESKATRLLSQSVTSFFSFRVMPIHVLTWVALEAWRVADLKVAMVISSSVNKCGER